MVALGSQHRLGRWQCVHSPPLQEAGGRVAGGVWAPPHLLCGWEWHALHNALVSLGWDKGDRDKAGQGDEGHRAATRDVWAHQAEGPARPACLRPAKLPTTGLRWEHRGSGRSSLPLDKADRPSVLQPAHLPQGHLHGQGQAESTGLPSHQVSVSYQWTWALRGAIKASGWPTPSLGQGPSD